MLAIQPLSTLELVMVCIGSVGLIAALFFLLKKKAPLAPPLSHSAPTQASTHNRWWAALSRSRQRFAVKWNGGLQELRESLEEACLGSDLGLKNTQELLEQLPWSELSTLPDTQRLSQAKKLMAHTLKQWLLTSVTANGTPEQAWPDISETTGPRVIWFVGVNGTGKTTSISKLAAELKKRGHSLLLAAGDTFRAAAAEQLETWAQRLDIPCVRGAEGADSSAVLFDAVQSGVSKKVDYILCDSAGRLHNQNQLMEALQKNRRALDKALPGAPHEVLLVLDANTGQNMLSQARQFQEAVGVTGLILTKLDGTARGGAVVAVARETALPIRRLGLGEQTEDFVPFEASEFAAALLGASSSPTTELSEELHANLQNL